MPGPLPESLRIGVYEAYGNSGYGQFMRRVVALQEGTMSLEVADGDVFQILGYDGGVNQKYQKYALRDTSCISHRPDLYRTFVEWSTGSPPMVEKKRQKNVPFSFGVISLPAAPPETLCLDLLTSEVLVKDLMALDTMLTMSPMMQTALFTGVGEACLPLSLGATRLEWHKELLKRMRTDT